MKYLKIQNKGLLDIRLVSLMGGTTKDGDLTKIGTFGTGLKYAITYLLRTENNFKLFIGEKEVIFSTREKNIKEKTFKEILINGKTTSITLSYGFQWKAWEMIREIWCNAIDEKQPIKEQVLEEDIVGKSKYTTFYIEIKEDIKDVIDNWNNYFIEEKPLFENENYAVFLNNDNDKVLKLYKNNILIHKSPYYTSLFKYDIKNANLNELREYNGFYQSELCKIILQSNKTIINILLEHYKKIFTKDKVQDNIIESSLDFEYVSYDKDLLKELFSGYLFVKTISDNKCLSEKIVKVPDSLWKILEKNNLPVEQVYYSSGGGYYGGSGGYKTEGSPYKKIDNKELYNKIKVISEKYIKKEFIIGISLKENFEFLIDKNILVFSSDLDILNQDDLECVYLMAVLHLDNTIHKVTKRLLKLSKGNKSFNNILLS